MISIPKCFSTAAQHFLHHKYSAQMSLVSQLKFIQRNLYMRHSVVYCYSHARNTTNPPQDESMISFTSIERRQVDSVLYVSLAQHIGWSVSAAGLTVTNTGKEVRTAHPISTGRDNLLPSCILFVAVLPPGSVVSHPLRCSLLLHCLLMTGNL